MVLLLRAPWKHKSSATTDNANTAAIGAAAEEPGARGSGQGENESDGEQGFRSVADHEETSGSASVHL